MKRRLVIQMTERECIMNKGCSRFRRLHSVLSRRLELVNQERRTWRAIDIEKWEWESWKFGKESIKNDDLLQFINFKPANDGWKEEIKRWEGEWLEDEAVLMILQFTNKDGKLERNEMRKMTCTEDSWEWKQSVLIHGHSLVGWNKVSNVIKVLLLNDKDGIDCWREQRMGRMIDKGRRC